jgi:predicted MFS family arabinose efflux permease
MTTLNRRLVPLYVGTAVQGCLLWVPVEKLFMNEIGFTPATVGVMAAAYAALVPVIELPSGILADRWSRRNVLVLACLALATASLLGGLATTVPLYVLSMVPLGAYFAMWSGTMDAIIYDTVLEETGSSATFERDLGRVRFVESITLVASALAGGVLANLASARLTYFLTVPFALLAALAFRRFREPLLHKQVDRTPLRAQVTLTWRTVTGRGVLLPVVAIAVLTSALLQLVFEFGPLWMIALSASALFFGPFWAAMVATLGLGGLLAGRFDLRRPAVLATVVAAMTAAALALVLGRGLLAVTVAQVVLALVLVVVGIHVTKLVHDAVPSAVRSGVASGVSAFTWLAFLPLATGFGLLAARVGVARAGWLIVLAVVVAGAVLVRVSVRAEGIEPPEPKQPGYSRPHLSNGDAPARA